MPQGGTLRIVLTCKENTDAIIRISDTGLGIPKGQESKIFDPFFTTKEQGTGLGLSIVHSVAKNHGGTISFLNNDGGGTTFVLTLPLRKWIMGCFGAVGPARAEEKER
jgi:signal transduction histidine kinase